MTSIQTGHSHRVMIDYTIKLQSNSVGTRNNIYIILSSAIIYDIFIFHLNSFDNINFMKYYVMLKSMIITLLQH